MEGGANSPVKVHEFKRWVFGLFGHGVEEHACVGAEAATCFDGEWHEVGAEILSTFEDLCAPGGPSVTTGTGTDVTLATRKGAHDHDINE